MQWLTESASSRAYYKDKVQKILLEVHGPGENPLETSFGLGYII